MKTYEKQPYVTEQPHGPYPAGSKVLATKTYQDVLIIEYEDGGVIEILNGWARGLDDPPYKEYSIWEAIKLEIDAQILGELTAIIKESGK